MRRYSSLFLLVFLTISILTGCALFQRKGETISWPEKITSLDAICDLNISYKDIKYSGDISIKLNYPDALTIEVYGAFGDTVALIEKKKGRFAMITSSGIDRDEKKFENFFHITTDAFLDDITMRGERIKGPDGVAYIQRQNYRVTYRLDDNENKMCWISPEGNICIRFLEVVFNKGQETLSTYLQDIDWAPKKGSVLLKPNLLSAKSPDKAVTTHPAVIRALAELLIDHSCTIAVGDSPGYGSTDKVLKSSGIMEVIKYLGLRIASFDSNIIKQNDGISPYKEFLFGHDPHNYDVVVNLPKLKSHTMMGMTLGVKNTFGFIHAFEKAKWHLRAGQDRLLFASMLIDIHRIVKPHLTIIDGIIGMDGNGPSSGRPKHLGIIGVARNAFALDKSVEEVLNLPYPMPVTLLSQEHGLIPDHEVIHRDIPHIDDFKLPETVMDTDWNLPVFAKHLLKNTLFAKPRVQKRTCKGCGICIRVCPSQALSFSEDKPLFDYKRCIRCYCCQEMCPEGAITV